MTPERLAMLQAREADYISIQPYLADLREKLLSLGGVAVVMCKEYKWEVDRILSRGVEFGPTERYIKGGRHNSCHGNSAFLWDYDPEKYRIVTGYALSDDGLWRQHSWCTMVKGWVKNRNKAVETTLGRTLYFGYVLNEAESKLFYDDNAF